MKHSEEAVNLAFTVLQQTITELSRDPGSMIIGRDGELHEINSKLEAENVKVYEELRKAMEVADIEKRRGDNLHAENAELREKLGTAKANGEDSQTRFESAMSELDRLKSSSQWAVTCEGMGKDSAAHLASELNRGAEGPIRFRAVPLHAPDDGPWVLVEKWFAGETDGIASVDGVSRASQYRTREEAERDCGCTYIPVRLSDVKT